MNKGELVAAIAEKSNFSKRETETIINATLSTIAETIANGDKVTIVGFGTFGTKERAARKGVNPQTQKKIKIAAKTVPSFSAGKALKEAVNK